VSIFVCVITGLSEILKIHPSGAIIPSSYISLMVWLKYDKNYRGFPSIVIGI